MTDHATNQQTLQAYNQGVNTYIAHLRTDIDGDLAAWFNAALSGLPKDARILEIGSGNGRDANYIEQQGYRVERTDGSQGFVDHMNAEGNEARLLNILSDSIDGAYQLILANAVFLHFTTEEFRAAAHKVHAALIPNGRFALTLKRGQGDETTDVKMGSPRHFRYWQPEEVIAELESIGFGNVQHVVHDDWRENKPQWLFITAQKGMSA